MRNFILIFALILFNINVFPKDLYSYNHILETYSYFNKSNDIEFYSDYEKYLKDPDDYMNVYAKFNDKNLKIIGFKNTITINNKKFNINSLPGMGRYRKDGIDWRHTYIYTNKKSICIKTIFRGANSTGQRYGQILFVEDYLNPNPYYFSGLFLDCNLMRKIKNKFYFPTFELFGSKTVHDAETVKFNYRQISPEFPIKYKYAGKFPDTSNVYEFELTKSEVIK